jgi:hypothetical protein
MYLHQQKTGTNVEGSNHRLFLVTTLPIARRDWRRQTYQSGQRASGVRNKPLIYRFRFHGLVAAD